MEWCNLMYIFYNLSSNLPFSLSSFPSFFPSYFTCFSSSFGANITEIFPFFIFCHSLHFFPTPCCRSVYSVLWGVCINLHVSIIQTTTLLEHQHWHLSRVQDQAEFTFIKKRHLLNKKFIAPFWPTKTENYFRRKGRNGKWPACTTQL